MHHSLPRFCSQNADIDKDAPIPYHYQLRELLRGEIQTGRWKVNDRLPSERELCETHNLSRTTVREALDALVNDGLLRREKGRGTFVAAPKILEGLLESPTGFTDSMRRQGYRVVTKVIRVEVRPPHPSIAHELHIAVDDPVVHIDRLRIILDEPVLVVTSYVPYKICPELVNEDLTHHSLYDLLQNKYGLKIARARRFLESIAANESEAQWLGIKPGSPLMLIESTAYLEDGTPVECFKAVHRGDRTRFLVESGTRILMSEGTPSA